MPPIVFKVPGVNDTVGTPTVSKVAVPVGTVAGGTLDHDAPEFQNPPPKPVHVASCASAAGCVSTRTNEEAPRSKDL